MASTSDSKYANDVAICVNNPELKVSTVHWISTYIHTDAGGDLSISG